MAELPTNEFARELARQLPVKAMYDDIGSPAAKQAGQLLQDVIKAIQLALAPVQILGALQDRYRHFIDKSIRRVPEQRRITPPPQIIGPVLEGIRYEPEETPIDEMFSQLMSRAMDKDRVAEAHPAYPILIKQLSADEAKILAALNGQQFDYVYTRAFDLTRNLFYGPNNVEADELPKENLTFPGNVGFYFEHLDKLGVAGIYQQGNQEPLFNEAHQQTGIRVRCKYTLTEFGKKFVQACVGQR